MITWPLSGHIIFALATGIACGIVAVSTPERKCINGPE
jgi:hypothetical protein